MIAGTGVLAMHGAENAFAVIDERPPRAASYPELARALCAKGGASAAPDGLLVVLDAAALAVDTPGASAHAPLATMRVFNADGSEAEMCGNGVRCVARYLADRGAPDRFAIATLAGPIGVEIVRREPFAARLDMGPVDFERDAREETLELDGATWRFHVASLGNPHAVAFVDDPGAVDLVRAGEAFGRSARFPRGVNLHVAAVTGPGSLRVRHFERGVGLTRACGTGAVACAAVAIATRGLASPAIVAVPGGTLEVAWRAGGRATLTGPAEYVARQTPAP